MADNFPEHLAAFLAAGEKKLPPLHLWDPALSGEIDIRIARDGAWYHEGVRFERQALVRMFASILKREGDEFFLLTPVEKWRISVEDAPFLAIACEVIGVGQDQQLLFVTNVGDRVHCNATYPLRVVTDPVTGEPSPYLLVRQGLEARLSRSVFYQLADLAESHVDRPAGVWSGGHFFALV